MIDTKLPDSLKKLFFYNNQFFEKNLHFFIIKKLCVYTKLTVSVHNALDDKLEDVPDGKKLSHEIDMPTDTKDWEQELLADLNDYEYAIDSNDWID